MAFHNYPTLHLFSVSLFQLVYAFDPDARQHNPLKPLTFFHLPHGVAIWYYHYDIR